MSAVMCSWGSGDGFTYFESVWAAAHGPRGAEGSPKLGIFKWNDSKAFLFSRRCFVIVLFEGYKPQGALRRLHRAPYTSCCSSVTKSKWEYPLNDEVVGIVSLSLSLPHKDFGSKASPLFPLNSVIWGIVFLLPSLALKGTLRIFTQTMQTPCLSNS